MFGLVSAAVGVLALVTAILLWWKKILPKVMALLALTASAGIAGAVQSWINNGAAWAAGATGRVTGFLFGAAVPSVLLLVALFVFFYGIWPKRSAGRVTAIAALTIPPLAQAGSTGLVGSVVIGFLSAATGLIGSGIAALFGTGG